MPDGQVSDVVAFLADQLASASKTAAAEKQTPGSRTVNLFMTQPAAEEVQRWTRMNNAARMTSHTSFTTVVSATCKGINLHNADNDDDDHACGSLTMPDLIWSCAESIFDNIPTAVPSLALACILKFAQSGQSDEPGPDEIVPAFCNFLCTSESKSFTNEVTWPLVDAHEAYVRTCKPLHIHVSSASY